MKDHNVIFSRPIIIAQDIRSGKTRRNVLRILKDWRLDDRKSVHECLLDQPQAEEFFIHPGSAIVAKSESAAPLMAKRDPPY